MLFIKNAIFYIYFEKIDSFEITYHLKKIIIHRHNKIIQFWTIICNEKYIS